MSAKEWAPLLLEGLRTAVDVAKARGLELPGEHELELEDLKAELNARAADFLPTELQLLALAIQATAVRTEIQVASLGEVDRCGRCNAVAIVHVEKDVHADTSTRRLSCDECGWKSA